MKPLRHISIEGYELQTWDTGSRTSYILKGNEVEVRIIAFKFSGRNGQMLFAVDNYGFFEFIDLQSDRVLRRILDFILKNDSGNKLPEEDKLALSMYTIEPGDDETPCTFINLDNYDAHLRN